MSIMAVPAEEFFGTCDVREIRTVIRRRLKEERAKGAAPAADFLEQALGALEGLPGASELAEELAAKLDQLLDEIAAEQEAAVPSSPTGASEKEEAKRQDDQIATWRMVCHHEAAHAVIAHVHGARVVMIYASHRKGDGFADCVHWPPITSKDVLRRQIRGEWSIALAGQMASSVFGTGRRVLSDEDARLGDRALHAAVKWGVPLPRPSQIAAELRLWRDEIERVARALMSSTPPGILVRPGFLAAFRGRRRHPKRLTVLHSRVPDELRVDGCLRAFPAPCCVEKYGGTGACHKHDCEVQPLPLHV